MAVVRVLGRNAVLANQARLATGLLERAVGLLGRGGLAQDEAMVFPRCRSVHTWFMRFPIDLIFLRQGAIVRLEGGVGPFRVVCAWQADTVVELASGAIQQGGLQVGDRLAIE